MRVIDLHRAARAAWLSIRAVVVLVAAFARELGVRLRPWPAIADRPYPCRPCKVEYADARALGWHRAGHHRDSPAYVFDDETIDPSIARERDQERARALEDLDLS
jgi:hypothetical protein